jgi:hypothetical protein
VKLDGKGGNQEKRPFAGWGVGGVEGRWRRVSFLIIVAAGFRHCATALVH